MNHNYVDFDPNGADDEVRTATRDHMNEIKHAPGPWSVENVEYGDETTDDLCILTGAPNFRDIAHVSRCYQGERIPDMERANANLIAAAPDMAEILEIIAADADAGKVMIPSGLRLSIDAALIKAGRKAAPEPVRHITVAGGAL